MNADRDANIRLMFGNGEQLAGIFEICGRRDHACDACGTSAFQHGGQITVELSAAEVRVGVKKHARRIRMRRSSVKRWPF
jgi:hypothetical protein